MSKCINCGKPRCDGHDADSWKRCAERYRAWSLQTERRCIALLEEAGVPLPSPVRDETIETRRQPKPKESPDAR